MNDPALCHACRHPTIAHNGFGCSRCSCDDVKGQGAVFALTFRDGLATMSVEGNLDVKSLRPFRDALETVGARRSDRVVVSLEGCTYCDSMGLEAILRTWVDVGRRFYVVVPSDGVCGRLFARESIDALPFVKRSMSEALEAG